MSKSNKLLRRQVWELQAEIDRIIESDPREEEEDEQ